MTLCPRTQPCVCVAGVSGKAELSAVLYEILLPFPATTIEFWGQRGELIFKITSSWDSAGAGSNSRKALIVLEVRSALKFQ